MYKKIIGMSTHGS